MKKNMILLSMLALTLALPACGVDVATSAATAAQAKAAEVREAQQTKQRLTSQLNAAMATGQQRLQQADQAIQ